MPRSRAGNRERSRSRKLERRRTRNAWLKLLVVNSSREIIRVDSAASSEYQAFARPLQSPEPQSAHEKTAGVRRVKSLPRSSRRTRESSANSAANALRAFDQQIRQKAQRKLRSPPNKLFSANSRKLSELRG